MKLTFKCFCWAIILDRKKKDNFFWLNIEEMDNVYTEVEAPTLIFGFSITHCYDFFFILKKLTYSWKQVANKYRSLVLFPVSTLFTLCRSIFFGRFRKHTKITSFALRDNWQALKKNWVHTTRECVVFQCCTKTSLKLFC